MATHACRTWLSARTAAQQATADPALVRALHIDAVRYMTMSLPRDLTPQEMVLLRQGIPQDVLSPLHLGQEVGPVRPNGLRSSIAHITCWFMAMAFFFLPLLMTCINKALVFERQHQITERVLTNSLDLGTTLGERGADLQKSLQRFREGPLGGALVTGGFFLVEGIAGGVVDGVRSAQGARPNEQKL